jgi:hypothetical protein
MLDVVDEGTLGQVFSENFGFPCHSFHWLLPKEIKLLYSINRELLLNVSHILS